jgi:hypothetical protein
MFFSGYNRLARRSDVQSPQKLYQLITSQFGFNGMNIDPMQKKNLPEIARSQMQDPVHDTCLFFWRELDHFFQPVR